MQADQARSGRRPALIPRGVNLTAEEEAALKTRVGDNVIPPPDPFIAEWTIRIPKRGSEEKIETPEPLFKKLRTSAPQESGSSDTQIEDNGDYMLEGSYASQSTDNHGYEYVFLPNMDNLHLKDQIVAGPGIQGEQGPSAVNEDRARSINQISTGDENIAESLFQPNFNYNSFDERSIETISGVIT